MFFSCGGGRSRPRDGVRFSFGGRFLPCDSIDVLWFCGPPSPPCGFVPSGNLVVTTATVAATITCRDFLFLLPGERRLREEDVDEASNFFFFIGFFSNIADGDSVFFFVGVVADAAAAAAARPILMGIFFDFDVAAVFVGVLDTGDRFFLIGIFFRVDAVVVFFREGGGGVVTTAAAAAAAAAVGIFSISFPLSICKHRWG